MGGRYGVWYDYTLWRDVLIRAGFNELEYYYRPSGVPRAASMVGQRVAESRVMY